MGGIPSEAVARYHLDMRKKAEKLVMVQVTLVTKGRANNDTTGKAKILLVS